jgi:nucleotide-binding universal stress UspA family protein
MTIKRILYASDFSRASGPAFKLARELAEALEGELILCHVYRPIVPLTVGEVPIPPSVLRPIWVKERATATRQLEALAKAARRAGIRTTTVVVQGLPPRAIVRVAKERRAHLLVLGTRGRTGIRRMLLGSVAEQVVRTAPCPVLTVGPARR